MRVETSMNVYAELGRPSNWLRNAVATCLLACVAAPVVASDPFTGLLRNATATEIGWIRAALQTQLKDADSAKFKQMVIVSSKVGEDEDYIVCGLINAKNSYGAYAGYSAINASLSAKRRVAYDVTVETENTEGTVAQACDSSAKVALMMKKMHEKPSAKEDVHKTAKGDGGN